MKKVLNNAKNSSPSKLIRRVLSKTSTTSNDSINTTSTKPNGNCTSNNTATNNNTSNSNFSDTNSTLLRTETWKFSSTNSSTKNTKRKHREDLQEDIQKYIQEDIQKYIQEDTQEDIKGNCRREYLQQMPADLKFQLESLREQVGKLQIKIDDLHRDTESKEGSIANLAREKEKLSLDLQREKRCSWRLKQQLDDEREFYYREKEAYCKEMNECKKMKQKLGWQKEEDGQKENLQLEKVDGKKKCLKVVSKEKSQGPSPTPSQSSSLQQELASTKKEIIKLKKSLEMFSESNYNLSIKFLRMKNTKYSLKNRLQKLKFAYDKLKVESQTKIAAMKDELSELLNNHYQIAIHPSNKRYLHLVKENGTLIHENLCLQLEVDRLTLEVERMRMMEIRKETNSKLKYINDKTRDELIGRRDGCGRENVIDDLVEDVEYEVVENRVVENKVMENRVVENKKEPPPKRTEDLEANSSKHSIKKIFERKKSAGCPKISFAKEPKSVREMRDFLEEKYTNKHTESKLDKAPSNSHPPNSQPPNYHSPNSHPSNSGPPSSDPSNRFLPRVPPFATDVPSSIALCNVSEISMQTCFGSTKQKENLKERETNPSENEESKTDLMSESLYYFIPSEAIKTQSAPEIVQSSCFVDQC